MVNPTNLSASERVYRHVKQLILDGELPGGEMITEGRIVTATGLSRTPVREGFLRLEAEGWLKLFPKRGALVVPVQPEEIEQVLEARHLIETHSMNYLAQNKNAAAAVSKTLHQLTSQMEEAMKEQDTETFTSLDTEFHLLIVASADNDILSDIYRSLRDRLRRMITRSVWQDESRMSSILRDHRKLADIVHSGDETEFAEQLMKHMWRTHERSFGRKARLVSAIRNATQT